MKLFITVFLCAMMAVPVCAQNYGNGNDNQGSGFGGGHQSGQFDGGRADMRHSRAANPEQVKAVVDLIKGISFDDERMKIATVCLQLRRMNAEDIAKVARCFTFDDGKKKFLRMAIEYCADLKNYYSLRSVITFSSDQEDFMKFVDNYIKEHPDVQEGRR